MKKIILLFVVCFFLFNSGLAYSGKWKKYENSETGFSIQYRNDFKIDDKFTNNIYSIKTDTKGISFSVPLSFTKGTNLSDETYISVEWFKSGSVCNARDFADDTTNCGTETINGRPFTFAFYADGAMGSIYEEQLHVCSSDKFCFIIRLHIRSSHADSDPDYPRKEYDRNALLKIFNKMVNSFVPGK